MKRYRCKFNATSGNKWKVLHFLKKMRVLPVKSCCHDVCCCGWFPGCCYKIAMVLLDICLLPSSSSSLSGIPFFKIWWAHGDGKVWNERKNYFNAFVFTPKTCVLPRNFAHKFKQMQKHWNRFSLPIHIFFHHVWKLRKVKSPLLNKLLDFKYHNH